MTALLHQRLGLVFLAASLTAAQAIAGSVPGGAVKGPVLWLKADAITGMTNGQAFTPLGGEVWTNCSESVVAGAIVQSGEPTYVAAAVNGLPVVRFDGDDALGAESILGLTGSPAFTVFLVGNNTLSAPSRAFSFGNFDNDNGNDGRGGIAVSLNVDTGGTGFRFNDGNRVFANHSFSAELNLGVWQMRAGAGYGEARYYLNGVEGVQTGSSNPTNRLNVADEGYYVGGGVMQSNGALGQFAVGDIAEIILYTNALSPSAINAVGESLAQEYALDFTPLPVPLNAVTSNLALWLKADAGIEISGGAVTNWLDQSGNGHHLRQGSASRQPRLIDQPLYGFPAVRFDGVDDFLWRPDALGMSGSQPLTLFAVTMLRNDRSFMLLGDGDSDNGGRVCRFKPDSSWHFNDGSAEFSQDQVNDGLAHVGTWRRTRNAPYGACEFFRDGRRAARTGGASTNRVVNLRDEALLLGAAYADDGIASAPTHFALGDIAELVVYTNALSDAEVDRVNAYLAQKYGLLLYQPPLPATNPPNVLLILADDLGWPGLSVQLDSNRLDSASDFFQTPHLDKLARRGMRFTSAYSPHSNCSPTRYSILTGKSPAQLHMTDIVGRNTGTLYEGNPLLPPIGVDDFDTNEVCIAEFLANAEPPYVSGHFGKWHIGGKGPANHGFSVSDGNTGNGTGNVGEGNADGPKRTFGVARRCMGFMADQVNAGRPFFCQFSSYAVHTGIYALQETKEKYAGLPPGERHDHVDYASMTDDLDRGIGMVLHALDCLGVAGNTYVVFWSDNGGIVGAANNNLPLARGKTTMWEGGIRVPALIAGPGVPAGTQSDVPVIGWDLFPTFADWAGVTNPLPANVEGGSLRAVVENRGARTAPRPRGDRLVFHWPHYQHSRRNRPSSAIRQGDYKLIKFWETGDIHLFNLAEDLEEACELSARMPDKAAELHANLNRYLAEVNALHAVVNPGYIPANDPGDRVPPGPVSLQLGMADGTSTVTWTGEALRRYTLDCCSNLVEGLWVPAGAAMSHYDAAQHVLHHAPGRAVPTLFYRVGARTGY